MSRSPHERKPWPLKWIVLAIVLFVIAYTYLTLHFRRPGHAYEPYAEMKQRANTGRLLAAGYQRVQLPVDQPSVATGKTNNAYPAPGGLPAALKATIVSYPLLPDDVVGVHAPDAITAGEPCEIVFRCVAPDDRQQLGDVELYVKGDEIVMTPDYDRLSGGLQSRTRDTLAIVTIPAHTLKPGSYRVTLVGEHASRAWRLQVQ